MGQIDARGWHFEVSEDPSIATPVWAAIGGIESFDLSLSDGEASTETTTFASNGVQESQAMQRGAKLTVTGKVVRYGATQDAGQESCANLAALVGEASLGGVRFRYVDDTNWTVWTAWVSLASNSGGINDKTAFGATFTKSGPATTAAVV
jgi:hypothetical protein